MYIFSISHSTHFYHSKNNVVNKNGVIDISISLSMLTIWHEYSYVSNAMIMMMNTFDRSLKNNRYVFLSDVINLKHLFFQRTHFSIV